MFDRLPCTVLLVCHVETGWMGSVPVDEYLGILRFAFITALNSDDRLMMIWHIGRAVRGNWLNRRRYTPFFSNFFSLLLFSFLSLFFSLLLFFSFFLLSYILLR